PWHELQKGSGLLLAASIRGRCDDDDTIGATEPAEGHRVTTFGVTDSPGRGELLQPGVFGRTEMVEPADCRRVAEPAHPVDHLANVAHGPAVQREVPDIDERLVA